MQDFFAALCLVFVIEGILPFVHPGGWRQIMAQATSLDDGALRTLGAVSMFGGLVALQFVKGGL